MLLPEQTAKQLPYVSFAHLIGETGLRVGITGTDGVYMNHRLIDTGDCSGPKSARNVLMHPEMSMLACWKLRGAADCLKA
ncbi:hypothetical protein [Polynucleobacter necessarius]|uniref:hypothetical protein n=1 Tax=Polynucleobacter necessarius TaxID=576610 RepID=UPI000E09CA99|nr:hypothetical protein [Polynucleobacter necessarius]